MDFPLRYKVIKLGPEWWVMDTMPHLRRDLPDEVVNKYTKDSKDRADEVAAEMNEHDRKKRGLSNEQYK